MLFCSYNFYLIVAVRYQGSDFPATTMPTITPKYKAVTCSCSIVAQKRSFQQAYQPVADLTYCTVAE